MSAERARGFTLIEVLVALAVVAIALPAVLFSLSQQVDGTAYLRDRSLAGIVAANRLEELRLMTRARAEVAPGEDQGVVELAGRDWYWAETIEATEVEQFYRVEVTVAAEESEGDAVLARLVAFMMGDLQQADVVPGTEDGGDYDGGTGSGTDTGGGVDTGGGSSGSRAGQETLE